MLLPVFWNLLLSGEQYADSSHLAVGKPNIAFHGGVSGLSYSQRDEWVVAGLVGLSGKILLTKGLFATAEIQRHYPDIGDRGLYQDMAESGLGLQVSPRNSVVVSYSITRFAIDGGGYHNLRGVEFRDRDFESEFGLTHSFYLKRKHILGPEVWYSYRNSDYEGNRTLRVGAHYRFLFE